MSSNFLNKPNRAQRARLMRRVLGLGAAAAMGSLAGMPVALAQTAPAGAVANNEVTEIVVTGSLIRRADTETPSPIQVISADDIAKTGFTNVADVLHNLSANGAGSLNNSFSGAFAGGASGIALRGLSVGATLTLIDGHRMVGYPLSDDGERNFVDVTSLPINAVERIEVLKDGASAVYGSDAIAGVVNVILKKTYTGAEIIADAGVTGHNDGTTEHASAIWGTGDLEQDGWNFYTALSFRHQDAINFTSRHGDITQLDFRNVGGVNNIPGAGSNPLVSFPGSLTGYLINPTGPNAGSIGAFRPGCNAAALAADQCQYLNKGLQLQPSSSTGSILSKFTVNLPSEWKSTTTASIFDNRAENAGAGFPPSGYPNPTNIAFPPGGNPQVTVFPPITVPANYPGNPYGVPAALIYNFPELGFPYQTFNSQTYRLVEDLDGKIAGWDVGISGGYMYAFLRQDAHGAFSPGLVQQALNNGYVLGSASGPSLFAPTAEATDSSNLYYITAHASKGLFELPSGKDFTLGVGAEWNEKKLNATAPPSSVDGTQSGLNNAWAIGSQADTGAFFEVNAPVIKGLEVDAALRYDHYNTAAGGEATPKFGVKYSPVDMLTLRGTWGKGFRAPSIAENNSGLAFLAATLPDPILCANGNPKTPGNFPSQCSIPAPGVQPGNRDLKPEKSTDFTAGFVFEPSKMFNLAVDYYDIKINQDIISAFEAGGLGIGGLNSFQRLGPIVTLPQTQANGTVAPAPTSVPLLTYISFPYVNASQTHTNGIDVDMHGQFDAGVIGNFNATFSYTRILSYILSAGANEFQLAGTHGPSGVSGDTGNPKNRGTLVVGWDKGPVAANVNFNYVGGFSITDPSSGQATCQAAINAQFDANGTKFVPNTPFPSSYCNVGSFLDVDLNGSYQLSEHLQLRLTVLNLFDKPAPFDAVTYGGGGGGNYSTLDQAGAVGRFYQVGATYKF